MSRLLVLSLTVIAASPLAAAEPLPRLKVSQNKRFLVTADGQPFFYLADTAWELFHRLNRDEAEQYLKDRAAKGYNVVQAVVLAEFDGLREPNPYGHVPLQDNDPLQPVEAYFQHVDWIVKKAAELGIYTAMLPTWGDKWNRTGGAGPEIFTPENAAAYAEWLARRYKDQPIIWVLGGDRNVETDRHKQIIRAMAQGIRTAVGNTQLITFHPRGGRGSAEVFHSDDWLDFNMRQNGHVAEFTGRYDKTREDYNRTPIKPVIDGEPIYEGHPISFKAAEFGYSTAADVRRPLYWDVFTGACGHTYGHHSIWQFYSPTRRFVNNPIAFWPEALNHAGAGQMQYGRWLMESRPYLTRIPDDSVIVADKVATVVPGAGRYRFVATRDDDGTYAMVYVPNGRAFTVRMDVIRGPKAKAWWYDPRTGRARDAGEHLTQNPKRFTIPNPGDDLDWILVLDDASKNYPPPGTSASR